jgi:putative membrane protein
MKEGRRDDRNLRIPELIPASSRRNCSPVHDGSKHTMSVSIPIVAAGAAVDLVPSWAWAQGPSETDKYVYGPHMMWWGGGWYHMIFGPLIMILVLAVVIAAAVLLVRWAGGLGTPPPGRTPLDILKERYARGEIDQEEYLRRRTDLQG